MLNNTGIIRNEKKIRAAVQNAVVFLNIQAQFGSFSNFLWSYVQETPIINRHESMEQVPDYTPLSEKISKDMKIRGFKMVGPTVIYSHLQAVGIVNDHLISCDWHPDNY